MSKILINDIFDELRDENQRLKQCLNVFIEFKAFVDSITDKLNTYLDSNEFQNIQQLSKKVKQTLIQSFNGFKCTENRDIFEETFIEINDNSNEEIKEVLKSEDKSLIKTDYNPLNGRKSKNYSLKKQKIIKESVEKTPQNISKNQKSINKPFICEYIGCDRRYHRRDTMKEHYRTHFSTGKHFCDFEGCSYRTRERRYLIAHINRHKGIRPHECSSCGQTFTSVDNLNIHFRRLNKGLNQSFVCGVDNCNKVFRNEFSLKSHRNVCHILEKKYVCDYPKCGIKTVSQSQLIIHKTRHSTERPIDCQFEGCVKTFKSIHDMKTHLKTHSALRNFKCLEEDCHKTYKDQSSLNKHMLSKHSDLSSQRINCEWPGCDYFTFTSRRLELHKLVHSTERKFPCDWPHCHKSFKRKPQLIIHLRIHSNDKRYACHWPGCQYRCVDSTNLTKHLKIHKTN